MNGFLLDTNVPSEISRQTPEPRVEAWLSQAARDSVFLSVITLGELRKGLEILGETKRRRQLEQWFAVDVELWFEDRILPVTRAIAERWGGLDASRQLQGRPLNTADGLIAATALEHGLSLVTRNARDFDGLGVSVVNPWIS